MKYLKKLVWGISFWSKILLFFIIFFFSLSCSKNYYIKKTDNLSEKIQADFEKRNGNSFYLTLDYATRSYVFSQADNGETTWLEIRNGKIYNKKILETQNYNLKVVEYNQELYYNCYENMDYFLFFSINNSGDTSYLNFNCLDSIKQDNIFLNYVYEVIKYGKPYMKD